MRLIALKIRIPRSRFRPVGVIVSAVGGFFRGLAVVGMLLLLAAPAAMAEVSDEFLESIRFFSSLEDRSTGTPGCQKAATHIYDRFKQLDLGKTARLQFAVPVIRHEGATLGLPDRDLEIPIHPLAGNAITPGAIPPPGLEGPLYYVGAGRARDFNGKAVKDAVVLMELDSGNHWLNAADFGARALIYVDRGDIPNTLLKDKEELTPIQFPRFLISHEQAGELFGDYETAGTEPVASRIRLSSASSWQEMVAENIYCLIEGQDSVLKEELLVVEAFYDSTALVPGLSPGAGEAQGMATLLSLAATLKQHPPKRSVLLVATAGHAQSLAGLRELVWSARIRSRNMRKEAKAIEEIIDQCQATLDLLDHWTLTGDRDRSRDRSIQEALSDRIKTEVDLLSRELMRLRLADLDEAGQERINELAHRRFLLSTNRLALPF